MISWISENIGSILVAVFLLLAVALIVWRLIANRKAGKSTCCGNCSQCAMCGSCRQTADKQS